MTRKAVIAITSGILVTEIVWHLYKAYRHYREEAVKVSNNCTKQLCKSIEIGEKIFDVMFFSNDSALCRSHVKHRIPCIKTNCAAEYLRRIVDYLDSAIDTLDICIYFFTSQILAEAIMNAHKRGVAVRVIIDETMAQNEGSKTMWFYKEGIKVRLKQLNVLMHHKFVIIDNNILINGSINWTMSAFFGNFENIIVTNESALVEPFVNEFEKIWTMLNVAVN